MDSPHCSHHRILLAAGLIGGLSVLLAGLIVRHAADALPGKVAEALNNPYGGDAPSL